MATTLTGECRSANSAPRAGSTASATRKSGLRPTPRSVRVAHQPGHSHQDQLRGQDAGAERDRVRARRALRQRLTRQRPQGRVEHMEKQYGDQEHLHVTAAEHRADRDRLALARRGRLVASALLAAAMLRVAITTPIGPGARCGSSFRKAAR